MSAPLLSVRNLDVRFTSAGSGGSTVHAVRDLSFDVAAGEALALLGESGSGKSVTLRTLLRLHNPLRARVNGRIEVAGQEVLSLEGRALQRYRGGVVSMVFQEAGSAFDPVYTIGQQIAEFVRAHEPLDAAAARARALEMLERVQIPQARRRLDAYPHELSGGMRQRAMIAMALACEPRLLIADEPTTALDVTIQAQILDLLRTLQRETGTAVILITHDLGVVAEVADDVVVMYAGRVVEQAPVATLFEAPQHPYTVGLLGSIPRLDAQRSRLASIEGQVPSPLRRSSGCSFAERCPFADARCRAEAPGLREVGARHRSACWKAPLDPQALMAGLAKAVA